MVFQRVPSFEASKKMSEKKFICPNPNCNYQNNTNCYEGELIVSKCKHWKQAKKEGKASTADIDNDLFRIAWTGNSFGFRDMPLITQRSKPLVIGVIGPSDAGKTTFLASLFNLLHLGKSIEEYEFSGSYTLAGWDHVSHPLEFHSPDEAFFPAHTSSNPERLQALLHLGLRKSTAFHDVLLTDVSGEWFVQWADKVDHSQAKGANWIFKHADCFLFFLDAEAFQGNMRGLALDTTRKIARRMEKGLKNRPVGLIVSKADLLKKNDPAALEDLLKECNHLFSKSKEFRVTVKKPNSSQHSNILKAIDWAISQVPTQTSGIRQIPTLAPSDYFQSYRGPKS